jgi:hypothetical protein
MSKKDWFPKAVEELIKEELDAVDQLIKEFIDPIAAVGNPEELIGKRYEQWTPEDLQKLIGIYGQAPDSPLSRVIFNREYEILKEKEEANNG